MTRNALENAIVAAMDVAADTSMQWGTDDCALWCANIIRDVFGYDPATKWRTGYRTRRGAMRALGQQDLLGALRSVARARKWKRVRPDLAQPGDVGMAWTLIAGRPVLATVICRAPGWFVGRAERGVSMVRDDKVAVAWSVLPDARGTGPGQRVNLSRMQMGSNLRGVQMTQEPVSTFIGLTAFISTTFGASVAVAGAVGGFVVTTALSIGVSIASSLMTPSTGASQTASGSTGAGGDVGNVSDISPLQGAQITERQSVPIKRVIVGSAYVGGAIFFEQVQAPYLTVGVMVNYGKIAGVDRILIGTNELSFSDAIAPGILTPLAVIGRPNYATYMRVSVRYGADDQSVDPLILAQYPGVGSEFRQRGIATIVYRYHFGGTDNTAATQANFVALWGQVARPTAYAVVRGVKCYDPRDATQSLADPTTWQWTNNATLVQTWYLTRPYGGRIPSAKIRWNKTIDSANYDDDLIGCNDGTMIRRHTIDGVISLNQQPFNVMQDLLTANRAMLLESGGMVWIESSRPKTSIVTIHDRILAGGVTYQAAKQKVDLVNKLQVRFVSPDQEYQIVDGPILDRTDLAATDGETLTGTIALVYTQDHRRAQRLQKAFLLSSRLNGTITCTVDIRLLAIAAENAQEDLIGQVVTVDSVLFSKMNGTYLVTAVGFADDCTTLALALTRYDATIESNWNPETDEQTFELATIDTTA